MVTGMTVARLTRPVMIQPRDAYAILPEIIPNYVIMYLRQGLYYEHSDRALYYIIIAFCLAIQMIEFQYALVNI